MGTSNDNRWYSAAVTIRIGHGLNKHPQLDWRAVGIMLGKHNGLLWRDNQVGRGRGDVRWEVACHDYATDITFTYSQGFPMVRQSQMYAFEQSANKLAQAIADDNTHWLFASAEVAIEYKSKLTPLYQLASVH